MHAHAPVDPAYRRDDMESLGYVMMYFLRGNLPWQGLKAATKRHKYEKISEKKMSTPIEILCKGYPMEFMTYFQYCRSLRFDDKPDYSYLRKMFRDLFAREGGGFRAGLHSSQAEQQKGRIKAFIVAFQASSNQCGYSSSLRCSQRHFGRAGPLQGRPSAHAPERKKLKFFKDTHVFGAPDPVYPRYQWDYVFDWTILKHAQNNTIPRALQRPDTGGAVEGGPSAAVAAEEEGGVPRPVTITESQRRRLWGRRGGSCTAVPVFGVGRTSAMPACLVTDMSKGLIVGTKAQA
eukprot:1145409-Pelagomonas_calceolata.AAC.4